MTGPSERFRDTRQDGRMDEGHRTFIDAGVRLVVGTSLATFSVDVALRNDGPSRYWHVSVL